MKLRIENAKKSRKIEDLERRLERYENKSVLDLTREILKMYPKQKFNLDSFADKNEFLAAMDRIWSVEQFELLIGLMIEEQKEEIACNIPVNDAIAQACSRGAINILDLLKKRVKSYSDDHRMKQQGEKPFDKFKRV